MSLLIGRSPKDPPYLHRGASFVLHSAHYHQQVHVARLDGCATSIGTEEHYTRWLESSDNAIHHGGDKGLSRHCVVSLSLMNDACLGDRAVS